MYLAEPYAPWQGMRRGSEQYKAAKDEARGRLWDMVEQVMGGHQALGSH
jgi:hypothetical protein